MTRVLVVGGGHNGLMAAIHTARSGLDVTVLEQSAQLGGATTSGERTLRGGAVHGMSGRGAAQALVRDRRLRRVR